MQNYLLYVKTGCPYCLRVLDYAKENSITFEFRNRDDDGVLDELVARGGKSQYPYLVDRENNIEMYESADIISYLQKEHAK
mgnify:CR=1 FL=1